MSACALASRRSSRAADEAKAEPPGDDAAGGALVPAVSVGYGSDSEMGGADGQGLSARNRSLRHLRDSRRRSSSFSLCALPPKTLHAAPPLEVCLEQVMQCQSLLVPLIVP